MVYRIMISYKLLLKLFLHKLTGTVSLQTPPAHIFHHALYLLQHPCWYNSIEGLGHEE